tara:strand:+ start:5385 stop:5807 length:423 start_codon:yes stop_codon:yes gene_type:complete
MTTTKYADCACCFPVTADVITVESAEAGDAEVRGYIDSLGRWDDYFERFGTVADEDGWQLSTLIEDLSGRRWEGDGASLPRWITTESLNDDLLTRKGDWTVWEPLASVDDALCMMVSIHRPDWITDASWRRVLRLLGAID